MQSEKKTIYLIINFLYLVVHTGYLIYLSFNEGHVGPLFLLYSGLYSFNLIIFIISYFFVKKFFNKIVGLISIICNLLFLIQFSVLLILQGSTRSVCNYAQFLIEFLIIPVVIILYSIVIFFEKESIIERKG